MSNIQQTNQINVNEVTPNTNSEYYLNMMIGSQIASQIAKFNAKDGFNYINITTLILLLSIGELKNLVKFISTNTSTYVVNNYKTFFTSLWSFTIGIPKTISSSLNYLIFNKYNYAQIEFVPESPINFYTIDSGSEFVRGLIYYLEDKKNESIVKYEILPKREIKFDNMETLTIDESWTNIEFYYSNMKIKLNSQLNLTFEKSNIIKQKYLKKFNQITIKDDSNKYKLNKEILNILLENKLPHIFELINDPIINTFIDMCIYDSSTELHKKVSQDIDILNSNTYNIIKSELDYELDGIEFITYLILAHYFPKLIDKQTVSSSLNQINYLFRLIIMSIKHFYPEEKISLTKIIFNKSYTELYFLDLHLKIPDYISDYIKKVKINSYFKKMNFVILTDYNITFYSFSNTSRNKVTSIYGEELDMLNYIYHPNTFFFESIKRLIERIGIYKKSEKKVLTITKFYMCIKNKKGIEYGNELIFEKGNLEIPLEYLDNSDSTNTTTNTSTDSTKLNFVCTCANNDISSEETNNIFNEFIDKVKSYGIVSNTNKSNIKICKIKLEKNPVKTDIPNPDYTVYLEKKEMLEKMVSSSTNNNTNNTNKSNSNNSNQINTNSETIIKELANIPPKTLTEITIKKEIKSEVVNSDYKSFDTMYLRESDEKKLLSVLTKFKSNKELLKSLGLPNKLCVMLDGLPGTGKSSTILTIASYLKKDIYYLSFGDTIETNEDLQMIFDHVVKNCNGGIIVAEDIDAVGSLLHSRTNNTYQNATQTMETTTQKLSLAYVLNLLQGTITPDNLIFIATTNHIDKLDPAFYRHGRFDVRITFKLADHYQLNKIYNKFFQRNIPKGLIERIEENKFTPAQFIFTIKDYLSEDFTDDIILQDFLDK